MKFNFCEDDNGIKHAKAKVLCIEYDGEISCFELSDLPPPPGDPRELGIVFPCCVKNKTQPGNKEPKIVKLHKPDTKQLSKNYSYLKQAKSNNKKPVAFEKCSSPTEINKPNKDCILYVFDKNGFNKVISYAKANIDCNDTTKLKGSKSGSRGQKCSDNRRKRMLNASLNAGKSLQACKSRELRGGVLFTDCFCLRRNGLQYDCRRTGCQNCPLCSVLPAPVCEPSRVACITHCSNPHAEELSSICKLRPW